MKRRKNNPLDRRKIVRHNTQSSTSSTYVGDTIPIDLIIEILSRLPLKTIAICRFVSKLWRSLLRRQDFTASFLACSSTRPRLLITLEVGGKWHFLSSPQPQNVDVDLSFEVADYHMGFSGDWYKQICLSVQGLTYLNDKRMVKGKIERVHVICNPSTGQQLTLPKVRARNFDLRSFFGYDPVDKQYKVLCMTVSCYRKAINSKEHQVLALGTGKLSWRKIECRFPHYPEEKSHGISINGVLYYVARTNNVTTLLACFDVRSEKFSFLEIETGSTLAYVLVLINYKGKLGAIVHFYSGNDGLWVLDDIEEDKWSKHVFILPYIGFKSIRSIWATATGEIVWAPTRLIRPFYLLYYNMERKSITRIEIKGLEDKVVIGRDRSDALLFTFRDHVENVMFLQ